MAQEIKSVIVAGINTTSGTSQDDTLNGSLFLKNVIDGGSGDDAIKGGFLTDNLSGEAGDDDIYGDTADTTTTVNIPSNFTYSTPPRLVIFANDVINGDAGDDFISGDQGSVLSIVNFATSYALTGQTVKSDFKLNLSEIWGNDTLNGGAGNDVIFGDAVSLTTIAGNFNGSKAIADGVGAHAIGNVSINDNIFTFGNDTINGGTGSDIIVGDADSDAKEPGGGIAVATNGGFAESNFHHDDDYIFMGHDIISGGDGNDIIYGDAHINSHIITGGDATADTGGTATTLLSVIDNEQEFGNDQIFAGSGNDIVYGDAAIYYNELIGGTATASNGGIATSTMEIIGTVIVFGNDYMNGGSGNKILYGDVGLSEVEVNEGVATAINGGIATVNVNFTDFSQIFGNDMMIGGTANNIFVGDALEYGLPYGNLSSSIVNVSGIDYIKITDDQGNNIRWGNDTMIASDADNLFVETLATMFDGTIVAQGNDLIQNFNLQNHTLAFGNMTDINHDSVVDLNDLKASSVLSYDGQSTFLNFNGGGSVELADVHGTWDNINFNVSNGLIMI